VAGLEGKEASMFWQEEGGRFTHESGSGFRTPRPKPGPSSHNPAPSRAVVLGPHGSALIKHFAALRRAGCSEECGYKIL
jgi:hypothetical protein